MHARALLYMYALMGRTQLRKGAARPSVKFYAISINSAPKGGQCSYVEPLSKRSKTRDAGAASKRRMRGFIFFSPLFDPEASTRSLVMGRLVLGYM